MDINRPKVQIMYRGNGNDLLPASDNAAPLRSRSLRYVESVVRGMTLLSPPVFLPHTLRVVPSTGDHMWEVVRILAFTSWKPHRNQWGPRNVLSIKWALNIDWTQLKNSALWDLYFVC